jgi:hypothetical protein
MRFVTILAVVCILVCISVTSLPALASSTEVVVEWGEVEKVGNVSFEIVSYGYEEYAWAELKVLYQNESVMDTLLTGNESIPYFVYSTEFEKTFYLEPINYTSETLNLSMEDVEMIFSGNPPIPKLEFLLSVNETFKAVEEEKIRINKTTVECAYIKERFPIKISIENEYDDYVSIKMRDSLPDNIVTDPYNKLTWTFEVAPMSSKIITYTVQALKPGEYILPNPVVNRSDVSFGSNNTSLLVIGPWVDVEKKVNVNGNFVEVNLTIKNTGNESVRVYVADFVPKNAEILSGKLNFTTTLDVNQSYSNVYTLKVNGGATLPRAKVLFVSGRQVDKYFTEDIMLPDCFKGIFDSRYAHGVRESNQIQLSVPKEEVKESEVIATPKTETQPPPETQNKEESKAKLPFVGVELLVLIFYLFRQRL